MISSALGARSGPDDVRRGLAFGGDYNPEQWPAEVWPEDARLMREAGVTFATVGVFSWARIEPEPGRHDFGWLDEVLDLLEAHDVAVDLATATASPPPWLTHRHPEVLPVDVDGRRLHPGSRQTWCPSSPVFRERSLDLVARLAERYRDHPALRMWHVSNELGGHNAHCYCDVSATAFRRWLEQRYGDLAGLNRAWGTDFWSQRYSDFEEIGAPRTSTAQCNPTQLIDFRRFSSEELLDQHRAERDLLHRLSPGVPVTTNVMVTHHIDALDYWRWAPELDLVSQDHYLDGRLEDPHVELSFCADWTRGLAGGDPWLLMEHSTSAVNWQPHDYPKAPGQMARNSLQHVARGADAVGFFQWRASRAGAEKYHSALLPHAGTESRVWREVVELGATLGRLAELAGTRVRARVAMLLDFESRWAVERDSLPSSAVTYLDRPHAFYRALWDAGVTVDVRHPDDDLSAYALVVAPTLHVVGAERAARLTSYVEAGGHLLTTYFSGIVDENDHVHLGGYPGALRDLLGVRVEELCPLPPGASVAVSVTGAVSNALSSAVSGSGDTWVEDLHLRGAKAWATATDGPMPGRPVVTRVERGSGRAWYVATRTDPGLTAAIVGVALDEAGVGGEGGGHGVEVVRRHGEERSYALVLNHTDTDATLDLHGTDLVTGRPVAGHLTVLPGGVACVREETS